MIRYLIIPDIPPDVDLLVDIFNALGDSAPSEKWQIEELIEYQEEDTITLSYMINATDDPDSGYVNNPEYTERYWVWDEVDIKYDKLTSISYLEVLRLYNPIAYKKYQPNIPLGRIY